MAASVFLPSLLLSAPPAAPPTPAPMAAPVLPPTDWPITLPSAPPTPLPRAALVLSSAWAPCAASRTRARAGRVLRIM
ncbi:hypothetical protein D9M70_290070 [compost metagenome]